MTKATKEALSAAKRGRPVTTGTSPLIALRLPPELLAALEQWMGKQDPKPSRPAAVRALLVKALGKKADER